MVSRRAFLGIVGATSVGALAVVGGVFHDRVESVLGHVPDVLPNSETPPVPEVSPTSDAPPVSDAMPSGAVVSNGTTWTPTLAEDFLRDAATGDVLTAYPSMNAYPGGRDTSGHGTYAPERVLSVHDSVLDFHLRTVDDRHLVASVLPDDYRPHLYGRVQLRYRASSARGYKFVGLFWPSSDRWNDGEIDWPEGDLDARTRPASAIVGSFGFWTRTMRFLPDREHFAPTDQTGFHVATTEWTPDAIRFYWDDDLIAEVNAGIPTTPMRVTLQAETWIGRGAPPDGAEGHIEIDWIVVYDRTA